MRALTAAAVALGALAPACGWHAGLLPPGGARTVGVEVFETAPDLHERNLEPILADALSRAVGDMVGAPLVPPSSADVVVRGRIEDYHRRHGIRDPTNRMQETGIFVSVTAQLVDRRTGTVLGTPVARHTWSGYNLGPDAARHEDEARIRALRNIAETLVLDLFGRARPASADPVSDAD